MMREMQRLSMANRDQEMRRENASDPLRVSINAITDLLGSFDGNIGSYKYWKEQLKLLRATYRLTDEHVKILIGMRLKGKASEWLHSKPEHIELPEDSLLDEMQEMYDHRHSKTILRKRFEERMWKKEETFHQYVHDKVILANLVPIAEDEIIDYLIDGIPVASLRDHARIDGLRRKRHCYELLRR